jgi:thioester reductase-like protein
MEEEMSEVIFITGATGLVGQNLIPRILKSEKDSRLILLIRGDSDSHVEQRFNKLLGIIESHTYITRARKRISWVRGDITATNLGIRDDSYKTLCREVTVIIHSAADVRFNLPLDKAREINLGGTRNVIEFALRAHRYGQLKHVGYIGTAYISGDRKGVIYEAELDCGQRFSNTYEQSKFEAECYVRTFMDRLPVTIFRPSIIIGDSRTGVTCAFNVIYKPLRMICRGLVRFLPGSRRTRLDIVPVDFVCDSICHIILKRKESIGKIYHLTAGKNACPSTGDIVRLSLNYINNISAGSNLRQVIFFPAMIHKICRKYYPDKYRKICAALGEYEPYLTISRVFDNSNTLAALKNTGISIPLFGQYYQNILGYCVESKWGKAMRYA